MQGSPDMGGLLLAVVIIVDLCSCAPKHQGEERHGYKPAAPPIEPAQKTEGSEPSKQKLPQSREAEQVGGPTREEIKAQLWQSPLGKLFREFILGNASAQREVEEAHTVVNRLFSSVTLTLTRMSALQLMIEDLYEQQLMTPKIHDRVSLLESSIALRRHAEEAEATNQLFKQLPVFIFIGIAAGSPLVRDQVLLVPRIFGNEFLAYFGRAGAAERAAAQASELQLSRLFSSQVFSDYDFYRGASTFVQTFGAYAIVFFRFRSGSVDSASIQEKIWIYGMQNVIALDEL